MSFRGNSIKKFLALLWLSLFFISMLAACGGDSGSAAPDNGQSVGESDPDLAEGQEVRLEYISERLLKEITYEEELVALAPEVFYNLFGIEEADVAEQYNYFSGGATSEEIVVMKATSAEALDRLAEAARNRIVYQKEIYASYDPEEVTRLEAAVLIAEDDCLFLCISSESDQAEEIIKEEMKS